MTSLVADNGPRHRGGAEPRPGLTPATDRQPPQTGADGSSGRLLRTSASRLQHREAPKPRQHRPPPPSHHQTRTPPATPGTHASQPAGSMTAFTASAVPGAPPPTAPPQTAPEPRLDDPPQPPDTAATHADRQRPTKHTNNRPQSQNNFHHQKTRVRRESPIVPVAGPKCVVAESVRFRIDSDSTMNACRLTGYASCSPHHTRCSDVRACLRPFWEGLTASCADRRHSLPGPPTMLPDARSERSNDNTCRHRKITTPCESPPWLQLRRAWMKEEHNARTCRRPHRRPAAPLHRPARPHPRRGQLPPREGRAVRQGRPAHRPVRAPRAR